MLFRNARYSSGLVKSGSLSSRITELRYAGKLLAVTLISFFLASTQAVITSACFRVIPCKSLPIPALMIPKVSGKAIFAVNSDSKEIAINVAIIDLVVLNIMLSLLLSFEFGTNFTFFILLPLFFINFKPLFDYLIKTIIGRFIVFLSLKFFGHVHLPYITTKTMWIFVPLSISNVLHHRSRCIPYVKWHR